MLPEGVRYQPFYCEENVFHLCQHPSFRDRERYALFMSGELGGCVMWHQRAARSPTAALFWDYHVVVLAEAPWEIWDLDSTLGCPIPAPEYLRRSFRRKIQPELAPIFRLVRAAELLKTFASDRSHMRHQNGAYERPPPPWPPVSAPERGSNLARFTDMTDPFIGEILSLERLGERVGAW